ncbi:LOW QUALITY PROTEIN: structural maintenance of chromosomes flexible hinge domain-containing protein 1 [Fundulus heteroclitus]|uniref:LOW QUALITY PROTEIN: structural maintenance of chromosomes flexible hinge domain-containing protein 1 n=1 Tax=Fundulus heteroclitus TaxID=8078 RepID=UPI00165A4DBA|nr:LOW QUALITY PROTEIN: structural maintenance of chromosomes flexible hinge domain-containing protein 1 [Fundulus heteroclitus]
MITVYDCRFENRPVRKKTLEKSGLSLYTFLHRVHEEFSIPKSEIFFVVTTDRTVVDDAKFEELQDSSTIYLLQNRQQALPVATEETINFIPHYNTLLESGTFEYIAEGQQGLSCALAELVDNSLSATAKNEGVRTIEIRLLFDKSAVIVLDNGCGMTTKQLNNWAVYRLSKFTRENSTFKSESEGYVRPKPVPRSLNSDISYFGVGGKQAAFHIGDSVRMISKSVNCPDVHELVLSKEEFQKKERNKEDVFEGTMLNRKPGDYLHITNNEAFLRDVIKEETTKDSFTAVVITGVSPKHINYLRQGFEEWTRQLAHIYHYYIHGFDGNCKTDNSQRSDAGPRIDILATLVEKPPKTPRSKNLRQVDDDMQTKYINSAVDTFKFMATTPDGGLVEGAIRYHPFLYDRETYPQDVNLHQGPAEEIDDENESGTVNQARGKRDIFECFWNGRLIPYTTVSEFDWCRRPSKGTSVPAECYSRFSGVLFTNDKFQVNSSKQKFMDLELKLKEKDTLFTPVFNVQKASKNRNLQKEFTQWLQKCHEQFDKQVKFIDYKGTEIRKDMPNKKMPHPWAIFSSIELDGKIYKEGQILKSQKTSPILYGTVVNFFLCGDHKGDVFATGGEVEIKHKPEGLYEELTKVIPITKIDRTATDEDIKTHIENERKKLPGHLKVDWPEGELENAVLLAGNPLGPLKVQIVNSDGVPISSRIHAGGQGAGIKLGVLLRVVYNGATMDESMDEEVFTIIAPYVVKHNGHWFKKIENLSRLGKYTLTLNAVVIENEATDFGGRELPSYEHKFTIKEGNAESFTVTELSPSQHVGVPFNIPLQIKDRYGHPTKPPPKLQPVLQCSGLELNYEKTTCSGILLTINGVKAKGRLPQYQQDRSYDLNVILPGLKNDKQTVRIIFFPGKPHSLHVKSKTNPVENGNPVSFEIEVHDEAGNITANPKQKVHCKISGLLSVMKDCSTGKIVLDTKPINQKIVNGEPQMLKATFDLPSHQQVAPVTTELMVTPSSRISRMELFYQDEEKLEFRNNETIKWQAGEVLKNLFYKLYDEAGREVPITAEIASHIEVTWGKNIDQRDFPKGRLPDLQVPTHVDEEHFCQVSYLDKNVSSCFKIIPLPNEPARLKATPLQNAVKLGETLSGNIKLELMDKYENITRKLTATCTESFSVEAEGLDKTNISFKWMESNHSIEVTGVRFRSGSLGSREICFSYKDFTESVILKVTPGVPSQLKLVSGPEQPLQVLNGHNIPEPFIIQLCDKWGNPSPDQNTNVKIECPSSLMLKLTANISMPVDAEGKACFVVNTVKGSKGHYTLQFEGSLNDKYIPGPSVNLTLLPDPNKPVRLSVDYDTSARFPAGGKFPVFSVTVFSDEGSPMKTFKPADLSMFLWEGVSTVPPEAVTELKCRKPIEEERKNCYEFREEEIPARVGEYTIEFSLKPDKTEDHLRHQITVLVVANEPVKLEPDCQPPTPVVFYCTDITNRLLVENMTLKITDQFGNLAGQGLNGTVFISIKCPEGGRNRSLPLFEGKTSTLHISLKEGSAHINRLAIMENSPGENGSRYILLFRPEVTVPPTSLTPFELPFQFYNDAENQQKKFELMRKKDELTNAAKNCEVLSESIRKKRDAFENKVKDADQKEFSLRNELNKRGVNIEHPSSITAIEECLKEKTLEVEKMEKVRRRVCSISNRFSGPDVLGMVGHLAFVADDDAARLISWQLQGDMDCVITTTTEAAHNIYKDSGGNQQVTAFDSIHVPQENRPMPHIRNGHELFKPPGNPTFARDLLTYPHKQQSCDTDKVKKVFETFLGDTILMDDLHSATSYRREVVKNDISCPTILTRQGDRLSARGKFGGAQNRAPSIDKLKVFGAPLPERYYLLKEQIDGLRSYRAAVEDKQKVEKDHKDHSVKWVNELLQNETKKNGFTKELQDIDRQLESASVRPGKRGAENSAESPGIVTKRPRRNSVSRNLLT